MSLFQCIIIKGYIHSHDYHNILQACIKYFLHTVHNDKRYNNSFTFIHSFMSTARDCPMAMVYSECVSKCPRTCSNLYHVLSPDCMGECYPGCQCPVGTFLHNNTCIQADQWPCQFQKREYPSGSVATIGCNHW